MTIYRFEKFVFDTDGYTLHQNNVQIAIRPKTAVLMAVLLEHRQNLLNKKDLFSQVWHSEHVQDQSLFQAISEIRKILAPLQPIKTHPNLGYQWVTPVKPLWQQYWTGRLAGAVLSIVVASAMLVNYWKIQLSDTSTTQASSQNMLHTPAMQAFANGIEHLNNQQLLEAWHFFDLAERENPLMLEAGVMKAEIFFQLSDYPAARTQTQIVLNNAAAAGERYVEVAAQSLLSRVSEQVGQLDSALEWALEADHNARDEGFACVAENTRNRIADLLPQSEQVDHIWLQPLEKSEPLLAGDMQTSEKYPDSSHCQQLNEWPDRADIKPDLSHCKGIGTGYQSYAARFFQIGRKQQLS